MPRIKLEIPEKIMAVVRIPVRISDINYGNHVGNDAFVSLIHEARMQWLNGHNYNEMDIEGTGLIMSELVIEFKKEAFYGDLIEIRILAGETTRVGFELFYQLLSVQDKVPLLLANAKTGMVCYHYEEKRVAAIPVALRNILEH